MGKAKSNLISVLIYGYVLKYSFKSGIKVKGLSKLKPILLEYLKINKETVELWNYEDLPWWYNERANLSLFTGAVWKKGGYALEEYTSDKVSIIKKYQGRNDLYFYFNKKDYILEAKVLSQNGNSKSETIQRRVNKIINLAIEDVRINKLEFFANKMGIVFVIPYFLKKSTSIENDFNNFIKSIMKSNYSALGWLYSEKANELVVAKKWVSPGLAVILKKV